MWVFPISQFIENPSPIFDPKMKALQKLEVLSKISNSTYNILVAEFWPWIISPPLPVLYLSGLNLVVP